MSEIDQNIGCQFGIERRCQYHWRTLEHCSRSAWASMGQKTLLHKRPQMLINAAEHVIGTCDDDPHAL